MNELSFYDVIREHGLTRAEKPALICGETSISWGELLRRADALASVLSGLGVGKGDRILWLGVNCHRLVELILAGSKIGAATCPANWRQSASEIAFVYEDLEPAAVVWQTEGPIADAARALNAEHASASAWISVAPGGVGYEELLSAVSSEMRPDSALPTLDNFGDLPLLGLYTAAFSGRPACALLSNTGILLTGMTTAYVRSISETSIALASGPLFHLATLLVLLPTLQMGGTGVILERVDAEAMCAAISRHRCTHGFVVRVTTQEMVAVNKDRQYDLSTFRAGDPGDGDEEWTAMTATDDSLRALNPTAYGQTQVSGNISFGGLGIDAIGTHGRIVPFGRVRVVAPDGSVLPNGEVGEIVVSGPLVMVRFHNRPEEMASYEKTGWWFTNDLGRFEADGSLSFIGPKGRLVKSGMENVYPAEVELAIKSHPAVRDCAVIGVPDEAWVQSVKAIVTTNEGSSVTEAELIDHCRSRIASYKKPKSIQFVDSIPTEGGVILYDQLDTLYGGGGYPGSGGATTTDQLP